MQRADKAKLVQAFKAAQSLRAAGRFDEALSAFRSILKLAPNLPEARFQVAGILAAKGSLTDATAEAEAILKAHPKQEAVWALLVDIARQSGRPAAVITRARKAGLPAEALKRLEARVTAEPTRPQEPSVPSAARPMVRRAAEATRAGDDVSAKRYLDRALAKAPGAAPILIRRAETQLTLGDLQAAQQDARAAVQAAPEIGGYWRVWARAAKVDAEDPLLPDLERRYKAAPSGSEHRRQMGFALAKSMEDVGAYERVFGFLNEANALTAKKFPYNHAADLEAAKRLREAYSEGFVTELPGNGDETVAPIFVTGMPRSGTTLVEQILASHTAVSGGGELGLLYKPLAAAANQLLAEGAKAGTALAEAGRTYAAEIRKRFPGADRVTDKSIPTYAVIGYVPLALPKAKIIVVRRDPRDSCLSVLKTQFADGQHRYSYSMEGTAAFYKLFADQVAFWRDRTPDAFIEVHYEDLVKDLEGQSRRLLDAAGLEWESGVLDFHRNEREVKTLSTAQVRQPIYKSSVGAWKRYETDLAPLFAALGPIDALP